MLLYTKWLKERQRLLVRRLSRVLQQVAPLEVSVRVDNRIEVGLTP